MARGATEGSKENTDEGKPPPITKGKGGAPLQGRVPLDRETGTNIPKYTFKKQGDLSP